MHIRPFTDADLDAVLRLSLHAWAPVFASIRNELGADLDELMHGPDWRVYQGKAVEEAVRAESKQTWVAEHDCHVTGFVSVHLHDDGVIGEIFMLAVDPDAQGSGTGSALTSFALDYIKQQGRPVAMVATGGDPGHAPARATYDKAGFTPLPNVQYFKAL